MRRKCAGDLPMDGAAGLCEWDGLIPFDQLPSYYNPPSGMLVSANQNPFSGAQGEFDALFRRIVQLTPAPYGLG